MKFWRIVAGDPDDRSLILGDWLRYNYISVGFEEPNQISRRRFEQMKVGDKVTVVAEGFVFAVGAITSDLYEKVEPGLYKYRRDVNFYHITREPYESFPERLKNKLQNPHTLIELDPDEWQTLIMCIL